MKAKLKNSGTHEAQRSHQDPKTRKFQRILSNQKRKARLQSEKRFR